MRESGELRWRQWVQDILDAALEIQSFVEGITFQQFMLDRKTLKAVEADLVVIGEAAGKVPEEMRVSWPQVPWQTMRAMRNRIVHAYFDVDPAVLWDTVRSDLPSLIPSLRAMMSSDE